MTQSNKQMSQEEMSAWVREQYQKANQFLAENGVLFESVQTEESRYLAPYVAIWKISALDGKQYWVITGDLPTDYMPFENENDPRKAMKHFSLLWHAKAENMRRTAVDDEAQLAEAEMLTARAEGLHRICTMKELWGEA